MLDHLNYHIAPGKSFPTPIANYHSANGCAILPVRVILMMSTSLDGQSLATLLTHRRGIEVLEYTSDADYGLARCQALAPRVLVIDPRLGGPAIERAADLIRTGVLGHMIVLDDRLHEAQLARVLNMPSVSYLTRQAGIEAIHAATIRVATHSERVFDPAIDHRIVRTPRGLRLKQVPDRPSITALTARELEVMGHLAVGNSVRDCAEQMQLSESTIDNHKSRLMKKLQIHKAAELTHVAIREGVISL